MVTPSASPPLKPVVQISPSIIVKCDGAPNGVAKSPLTPAIPPMPLEFALVSRHMGKCDPDGPISSRGPFEGMTSTSGPVGGPLEWRMRVSVTPGASLYVDFVTVSACAAGERSAVQGATTLAAKEAVTASPIARRRIFRRMLGGSLLLHRLYAVRLVVDEGRVANKD